MTTPTSRPPRFRTRVAGIALAAVTAGGLAGCSTIDSLLPGYDAAVAAARAADSVWDPSAIHVVSIDLGDDAFRAMVKTYEEKEDKEWLKADVTIDGETFEDVGLRLKGNSSLGRVSADSDPADLPWLIDLDKFVDGQKLDGWERFVIRSNSSKTALNEAVALDLLKEAGLASSDAVATRFSVNGSTTTLRLMVQDLDDHWDEDVFGTEGTLYKSEAGGDWSYRGDDAKAYADVFDIEAGDEDFAPLTDFLKWLEESSDEEFANGLADRLDVEAFATYLAFEDLVGNFDDIEGPGNNSFLRWDAGAEQMTVVAWDHNLAFGTGPGGRLVRRGADGERLEGGRPPEGFEPPDEFEPPEGMQRPADRPDGDERDGKLVRRGGPGEANVLAKRFRANDDFSKLYDDAITRLKAELFDDGSADEVLDTWTALLKEKATDLVKASTIDSEAKEVSSYFDGHGADESNQDMGRIP